MRAGVQQSNGGATVNPTAASAEPQQAANAEQLQLRALFIEDSPDDLELVLRRLRRGGMAVTAERVSNTDEFARAISTANWDVVLCDYSMPHTSPEAIINAARELGVDVPIIVISGLAGEEVAVEVMRLGACDFVAKDNLRRLDSVVRRELQASEQRRATAAATHAFQARLHRAHKFESVGLLAAGIAHEINTPMQFIGDNLTFLRDSLGAILAAANSSVEAERAATTGKAQAELQHMVQAIADVPGALRLALEGVSRVKSVLKAMTGFVYPGQYQPEHVDLGQLIERAVVLAQGEWKLVANVELTKIENVSDFPCYPDELGQVLLNMIVNAAHAIAAAARAEPGRIEISASTFDGGAEIRISDNGTGLAPEILPHIFDPFFTTKSRGRGTGLGLSLAYATIVNLHGGDIAVESKLGVGTTFIIFLPHKPQTGAAAGDA